MNLYVRYFQRETLARSVGEALDFLHSIENITIDPTAGGRINTFLNSPSLYPFRLKVSYSNYVLFLKTHAETLEQFKTEETLRKQQKEIHNPAYTERKKSVIEILNEEKIGWWKVDILFKRVLTMADTGKCRYIDTPFCVKLKANSALDAYRRVTQHLRERPDVDSRSQFPSVKSDKFAYQFLGEEETA